MFSFFGHKKKSPVEGESSQPPIPSAESFVVVKLKEDPPPNAYYPTNGTDPMYPSAERPSNPITVKKEIGFLQGVPFKLSKELSTDSADDIMAMQLSEIMAYCTRRLQINSMDYDFTVEKSVLMES